MYQNFLNVKSSLRAVTRGFGLALQSGEGNYQHRMEEAAGKPGPRPHFVLLFSSWMGCVY